MVDSKLKRPIDSSGDLIVRYLTVEVLLVSRGFKEECWLLCMVTDELQVLQRCSVSAGHRSGGSVALIARQWTSGKCYRASRAKFCSCTIRVQYLDLASGPQPPNSAGISELRIYGLLILAG